MDRNRFFQDGKGDTEILTLLEVSNDIAFCLSNVSQYAEKSLLCEYSFDNVTIFSSFWDGIQEHFSVCNSTILIPLNTSLNFPTRKSSEMKNTASYIELPEDITKSGFKSAGVYIAASNLIQLILPGSENT